VDNAAKYSPPASPISIRAVQHGESIVLSVADRGPGISGPDRERIFERFYRGHAGRGPISGTGMGLAIAREIIRAHNGEIGVESQLGRGSEFHFSLPVARAEAEP
jgi:signal transduction histidine kinase